MLANPSEILSTCMIFLSMSPHPQQKRFRRFNCWAVIASPCHPKSLPWLESGATQIQILFLGLLDAWISSSRTRSLLSGLICTEVDELVIVMRHDFEKMYKGEGRCKIHGMYCFAVYENTGDEDNIVMYPYVKHVAPLRLSRLPTDDQMTHRSKATARGQAPCTRGLRQRVQGA